MSQMKPSATLVEQIGDAIANLAAIKITDPGTAAATCDYVWPIQGDFPDIDALGVGDLPENWDDDEATKLQKLSVKYGAQQFSFDSLSGKMLTEILPLTGQWRWETDDGMNFPFTLYGFVLTNHAGGEIIMREKLDPPIVFTGPNQSYQHPRFAMEVDPAAFKS